MKINQILDHHPTDRFYVFMTCLFSALRKVISISQNKQKIESIEDIQFFYENKQTQNNDQNIFSVSCEIKSKLFKQEICFQENCFSVYYFLYASAIPLELKENFQKKNIPTSILKSLLMMEYFFVKQYRQFNEPTLILRFKQDLKRFQTYSLHVHGGIVTKEKKKYSQIQFKTTDITKINFFQQNFTAKERKVFFEKREPITHPLCNCLIPSSMRSRHTCDSKVLIAARSELTLKINERHFQNIIECLSKSTQNIEKQPDVLLSNERNSQPDEIIEEKVISKVGTCKKQDQKFSKRYQAKANSLNQNWEKNDKEIEFIKFGTDKEKINQRFDIQYRKNQQNQDKQENKNDEQWCKDHIWDVYFPYNYEKKSWENLILMEHYGRFWKEFKPNCISEIDTAIQKLKNQYSSSRFNCRLYSYQPFSIYWKYFQKSYQGIDGIFSEKMFASKGFRQPENQAILILSWIMDILIYKPEFQFFSNQKLAKIFRIQLEKQLNSHRYLSLEHIHIEKRRALQKILHMQYTRRKLQVTKEKISLLFSHSQKQMYRSVVNKYIIERDQFVRKIIWELTFLHLDQQSSCNLKEDREDLNLTEIIQLILRKPQNRIFGEVEQIQYFEDNVLSDSSDQKERPTERKKLFQFQDNSILKSVEPKYIQRRLSYDSLIPNLIGTQRKESENSQSNSDEHDSDFFEKRYRRQVENEQESSSQDKYRREEKRKKHK